MKNCSGLEGLRDRIPMMEMKEGLEGSNSIPMRLVWLIRETRDLMIASLYEIKINRSNTIQQCCVVELMVHRDRVEKGLIYV